MPHHPSALELAPQPAWRRFWQLLGAFLAAFFLAALIPTPGAWSDVRSQWASPAAVTLTVFCFLFAAQWHFWRGRRLSPLQLWILSVLCGAVLALAAYSLWECVAFPREVSRLRSATTSEALNESRHAIIAGLLRSDDAGAQTGKPQAEITNESQTKSASRT